MTELRAVHKPERVAGGDFDFVFGDVAVSVSLGPRRARIKVSRGHDNFVDRVDLESSRSRAHIAKLLAERGLLSKDGAVGLLDKLAGWFASEEGEKLAKLSRSDTRGRPTSEITRLIDNPLNPKYVVENLDRALQLLTDKELLSKVRGAIRKVFVAPGFEIDSIIYHQASVFAPPIPRFSNTGDEIWERGTEALLPYARSGFGKGALAKLLRVIGVRVIMVGRFTRAALERNAKELLDHSTLFFPEISHLYLQTKDGTQIETDTARIMKQAIEDSEISLVREERDEATGGFVTRAYRAEVYPAPIMTTVTELEDIQMRTRAIPLRLPDTVGGVLEIGRMVAENVLLSSKELSERKGRVKTAELSLLDVYLINQTTNCVSSGVLEEFYGAADDAQKKEVEEVLKKYDLSLDYIKPIKLAELTGQQRRELLCRWGETILAFALPPTIHFADDKAKKRQDVLKDLKGENLDEVLDVVHGLGLDAKAIEGITRDLWNAIRRVQSSGLFHMFQREFEDGEDGRILKLTGDDLEAGFRLLDRLATERIKFKDFSPRERELIVFTIRNTSEGLKLSAKEIAKKFYGKYGEKATEGRARYIQRILKKASDEGKIECDKSERTHRYWADVGTADMQPTLGAFSKGGVDPEVEGEFCTVCGKPAEVWEGAPLCRRCAEEERKRHQIEKLEE